MKMQVLRVIAIVVFAALAVGARAQTLDSVVVTVPFDFIVGNTTLPAGTYTVDRLLYNVPQSLALRSTVGNFAAIASGEVSGSAAAAPNTTPKLVFNRYGDQYFLHEILTNAGVHQLSMSRSETKVAAMVKSQKVAANGY